MNTHNNNTIKQLIKDHYDDRGLYQYHDDEDYKQQLEKADATDLRMDWLAIDLLGIPHNGDHAYGAELAREQDKYDEFCDVETWCENNVFEQIKSALMQSQDQSTFEALVGTFEIGNTINI